jgi:hypothetical protein
LTFPDHEYSQLFKAIKNLEEDFLNDSSLVDEFHKAPYEFLRKNYNILILDRVKNRLDLIELFDREVKVFSTFFRFPNNFGCSSCILAILILIIGLLGPAPAGQVIAGFFLESVLDAVKRYFNNSWEKIKGFYLLMNVVGFPTPHSLAKELCIYLGMCPKD